MHITDLHDSFNLHQFLIAISLDHIFAMIFRNKLGLYFKLFHNFSYILPLALLLCT